MGVFVKNDIVVVPFPFSDLKSSKRRPALVLARASERDLILAEITSRDISDDCAVKIEAGDFTGGGLRGTSIVRANKLFTAFTDIIEYKAGTLKPEKSEKITSVVIRLLQQNQ